MLTVNCKCVLALCLSELFSGRFDFIVMKDLCCGCGIWVVNLCRVGERFLDLSRLLGSQTRPLIFFFVFLWFSIVWKIIIVSGLRGSGGSESGVSDWGGGSFCELAICEGQWADRCRVGRLLPVASPGVW